MCNLPESSPSQREQQALLLGGRAAGILRPDQAAVIFGLCSCNMSSPPLGTPLEAAGVTSHILYAHCCLPTAG